MVEFDTHGGNFAPEGYMKIDAGGSHEENRNGGVQVGIDPNGAPNLLQEGESVYQDFVYSNEIDADADILKEFKIPEKFAGRKYSDIVDEYVDVDRPNDPISNNGMNAMLMRLANAQEEQKRRAEMKEIEDELSKMTPEERAELEALLADESSKTQTQTFEDGGEKEQADIHEIRQYLIDNFDLEPNTVDKITDRLTGQNKSMVNFDPKLRLQEILPTLFFGERNLTKYLNNLSDLGISYDDAWKLVNAFNPDYKNPSRGFYYNNLYNKLKPGYSTANIPVTSPYGMASPEVDIFPTDDEDLLPQTQGTDIIIPQVETPVQVTPAPTVRTAYSAPKRTFVLPSPQGINYPASPLSVPGQIVLPDGVQPDTSSEGEKNKTPKSNNNLPTWPRYTGAVTAGLMGLYNAFQKPDEYTSKRIRPTLMDTRLETINPVYNPVDANIAANQVLSGGAGTVRALRNSGLGPSTGAAIVAADYNIGRNIGDAYTKVAEHNDNLYNNIIGQINANRQAQAQVGLNRERQNTGLLYDAALRNNHNDMTLQQLNYGAEGQKYGALQTQIDQVAEALTGIGQENFAMNQVNALPSGYKILPDGRVAYVGKCGGSLLRKYKK